MGKVYRARHARHGLVAVKRASCSQPAHLRCLQNELEATRGIRHHALIRQHELVQHADEWWLVMEYVNGRSLAHWLRRDAPAPLPTAPTWLCALHAGNARFGAQPPPWDAARRRQVCRLFLQIAQGLQHLHERGWIHRDLKPENVMVDADRQRAVIIDMGIASKHEQVLAGDYVPGGTLVYMAPELLRPGGLPSFSSDWYAFGLMLHEAVTGIIDQDYALRVLGGAPPCARTRNPALDEEVAALCRDLLQPAPNDRAGADQVLQVLSRGAHTATA